MNTKVDVEQEVLQMKSKWFLVRRNKQLIKETILTHIFQASPLPNIHFYHFGGSPTIAHHPQPPFTVFCCICSSFWKKGSTHTFGGFGFAEPKPPSNLISTPKEMGETRHRRLYPKHELVPSKHLAVLERRKSSKRAGTV